MASRALAASASGADDYRTVYDAVLSRLARPAILHWLGEMFDPGSADTGARTTWTMQQTRSST